MALPATLVVEVRPTNGTADGGGGYDPAVAGAGTDRSQQNAVEHAYTDLVIDAVTNTDVTSAGRAFTSDDIGNNLAVTGGTGFTVGIYNIRSIPSGNIARLDRAVGTTGSTGGTAGFGGARNGLSTGTTALQTSGVLTAGTIIHVKNEAWNEAISIGQNGAAGAPILVQGYNTSRGDIDPFTSGNANNPTNNRASAAGDAIGGSATNWVFRNINATEAGDAGFATSSTTVRYENCKSYNNVGEGWENGAVWVNCVAYLNGGAGFNFTGVEAYGCVAISNGSNGFDGPSRMEFSISAWNASAGCRNPGNNIENCALVYNVGASSDGLLWTSANASAQLVLNNILAGNGRYGANSTDGDSALSDYNCFFDNGTAARNNWPTGAHDITLDPQFTTVGATADFAPGDVDVGANEITVTVSSLAVGMVVRFTNSGGGLPGGLTAGTAYFVIDATSPIQVSATRGGAAVNITTQGTGTHTIHAPTALDFTIGTNLKGAGFPGPLQV